MNTSYITNANKNQKISEFSKVKLKNYTSSDIRVPVVLYTNNSYVNVVMDMQDILKYSYSYSLNTLYNKINNNDFWEEYDGEPKPEKIIYDLDVENPHDITLQDL